MKTLLNIFFFFLPIACFSQQSKIDSLLVLITKDKEDTNKVLHLNLLAREYTNISSYDTALRYSNTSLRIAEELNFKVGIALAYNNIGNIYKNRSDYPKALDSFLKGLKIDEEAKNKKGIAGKLNNIGNVYSDQGDYTKALDYYLKALKINEEIGNKNWQGINLGNLGVVYYNQNNFPKALENYFNALKIAQELGDKIGIARHLGNIGSAYSEQGKSEESQAKKDSLFNKALDYDFKGLKIAEDLGAKDLIVTRLGNIGSTYINVKQYTNAENYLLEAIALADSIGYLQATKTFTEYLSVLYTKTNRYDLALEHYKKAMALKDTIFNEEKNKEITRKEMNYEFEKKEAVTKAEHDSETKQQKIVIWSVIGGLLLVIVFAGFIFRSLRVTRKQKQIIEVQKSEVEKSKHIIEEKNKDITDSINYAKRIQQAKLPSKEIIYSALPDSFVLFKPKDIVSGDFYFFHKTDTSVFIASADCTGHGVPGALMSMIGSEKLDDALAHSADTSEILRQLNKGVKNSLHQTDNNESTRDGMDIALCSVDTNTGVVKYAGANRPIWIIRNGQTAVEEIKATKKAIGGFTDDSQHFDSHEIKFEKGDTFYISTDGYADTFGGSEQKKVTTKRFKEILLSIQDKSMQEQERHLDSFIENWKGGTEQVDDILVIGVRL